MHEFDTPAPVRLRIEIHAGDVTIEATDTTTTTVLLEPGHGEGADELVEQTIVEQRGDDIIVEAPRRSSTFFRRTPSMDVVVRVPHDSTIDVRVNSGDLQTTGRFAAAKVKSGSGDVQLDLVSGRIDVATGSGDIQLRQGGGATKLATGSGDVLVREVADVTTIGTGSGDVQVREAHDRIDISSGSGDVTVEEAHSDVSIKSASGDQQIGRAQSGRLRLETASGDVQVGIAEGVPAWLDVHTLTGSVSSGLGASEPPTDGETSVAVSANTVTGDISLFRA
jgi:DUF4097 and DUF4098 domain-containing protein YvlB